MFPLESSECKDAPDSNSIQATHGALHLCAEEVHTLRHGGAHAREGVVVRETAQHDALAVERKAVRLPTPTRARGSDGAARVTPPPPPPCRAQGDVGVLGQARRAAMRGAQLQRRAAEKRALRKAVVAFSESTTAMPWALPCSWPRISTATL